MITTLNFPINIFNILNLTSIFFFTLNLITILFSLFLIHFAIKALIEKIGRAGITTVGILASIDGAPLGRE